MDGGGIKGTWPVFPSHQLPMLASDVSRIAASVISESGASA